MLISSDLWLDEIGVLWYIEDMVKRSNIEFSVILVFSLGLGLLAGCTVLSPVGSVITTAYENTVSYFNAYYNASKLFQEAESEILALSLSQQNFLQGELTSSRVIPQSARQKLNLVVDKCSNILAFHPTSALVDDALLLIGKSYYYMGEYAKADRKFTELLTQFPQSAYALESQLWLVKSSLHLSNPSQALDVATNLVEAALTEGENGIAGHAYSILGDYFANQGDARKAIENYSLSLPLVSEKIDRAITTLKIGNLWLSLGDNRNAVDAFLRVRSLTSDSRLLSQSGLQAIRANRNLGKHAESLELCDVLLRDFRVLDYVKEIKLEKAATLVELKQKEEALDLLASVDTSSARSEFSTRAAFASGQLHEKHFRDYKSAAAAYARATEFNVPSITPVAQTRFQAITRYTDLVQRRSINDSLLTLPDTLVIPLDSMVVVTTPIAAATDSTEALVQIDTLWSRTVVINHDSLSTEQIAIAHQIGELFYADLEELDSSLVWYERGLRASPDSLQDPRAIFVVAELSARDSSAHLDYSTKLYRSLVDRFPSSTYATIAKQRLGIPVTIESEDPAKDFYTIAENKLEEGNARDALRGFREIIQRWPKSTLAAQSTYAIGWIYEHKLAQPDSAIAVYRRIVDQYESSPYAAIVRPRIGLAAAADESGKTVPPVQVIDDEVKANPSPPAPPDKDDLPPGSRRERAAPKKPDIKD